MPDLTASLRPNDHRLTCEPAPDAMLRGQIDVLQTMIAMQQAQLATHRREVEALIGKIAQQADTIDALRTQIAAFVDPDPQPAARVMPAAALRTQRQAIGLLTR